jgi:hypothetical protein
VQQALRLMCSPPKNALLLQLLYLIVPEPGDEPTTERPDTVPARRGVLHTNEELLPSTFKGIVQLDGQELTGAERTANYEAETVGGNKLNGRRPVMVLAASEVVTAAAVMAGATYRRAALRMPLFRVHKLIHSGRPSRRRISSSQPTYLYTTIDVPRSSYTAVSGISDAGQVVGYIAPSGAAVSYHGFLPP